jgi:hypothetical protein
MPVPPLADGRVSPSFRDGCLNLTASQHQDVMGAVYRWFHIINAAAIIRAALEEAAKNPKKRTRAQKRRERLARKKYAADGSSKRHRDV